MKLNPQERTAIAPLEARFSKQAGYRISLDRLLSGWEGIVKEIEEGYEGTVDDYTNDLCTRDLLEELLQSVSVAFQRRLLEELLPVDDRFKRATRFDSERLLSEMSVPGDGWWWTRLPKKLMDSMTFELEDSD